MDAVHHCLAGAIQHPEGCAVVGSPSSAAPSKFGSFEDPFAETRLLVVAWVGFSTNTARNERISSFRIYCVSRSSVGWTGGISFPNCARSHDVVFGRVELRRLGLRDSHRRRVACHLHDQPLNHVWGARVYETTDTSRNNPLLAFLTFGEGWHNNHHYYQVSARQGFLWWEYDMSYYVLRSLELVGLIRDVKRPTERVLAARGVWKKAGVLLNNADTGVGYAEQAWARAQAATDAAREWAEAISELPHDAKFEVQRPLHKHSALQIKPTDVRWKPPTMQRCGLKRPRAAPRKCAHP